MCSTNMTWSNLLHAGRPWCTSHRPMTTRAKRTSDKKLKSLRFVAVGKRYAPRSKRRAWKGSERMRLGDEKDSKWSSRCRGDCLLKSGRSCGWDRPSLYRKENWVGYIPPLILAYYDSRTSIQRDIHRALGFVSMCRSAIFEQCFSAWPEKVLGKGLVGFQRGVTER